MSRDRPGSVLPDTEQEPEPEAASASGEHVDRGVTTVAQTDQEELEAFEFVRFCYRRRSVAWPELYDEMCAVAARGDYRGMTYEQLERLGIGFALAALPRLAAMAARVIAEERGPQPAGVAAG